jgi:hypothetical protein
MKKVLFIFLLSPLAFGFQTNLPYVPPYNISQTLDLVFEDSLQEEKVHPSLSKKNIKNAFIKIKEQLIVSREILLLKEHLKRISSKDIHYFTLILFHLEYMKDEIEKSSESKTLLSLELLRIIQISKSKIHLIIKELIEDLDLQDICV